MDRKEKINELIRKNRNCSICKERKEKGISVSLDNFLDLNETLRIQKKIMNKMDGLDEHNESIISLKNKEQTIKKYKVELKRYINIKEEYIFYIKESTVYGAILLAGKTLLDNIDYIISESELLNDSCCIFCCTPNVDFGICVWAGEYDDRIYIWQ